MRSLDRGRVHLRGTVGAAPRHHSAAGERNDGRPAAPDRRYHGQCAGLQGVPAARAWRVGWLAGCMHGRGPRLPRTPPPPCNAAPASTRAPGEAPGAAASQELRVVLLRVDAAPRPEILGRTGGRGGGGGCCAGDARSATHDRHRAAWHRPSSPAPRRAAPGRGGTIPAQLAFARPSRRQIHQRAEPGNCTPARPLQAAPDPAGLDGSWFAHPRTLATVASALASGECQGPDRSRPQQPRRPSTAPEKVIGIVFSSWSRTDEALLPSLQSAGAHTRHRRACERSAGLGGLCMSSAAPCGRCAGNGGQRAGAGGAVDPATAGPAALHQSRPRAPRHHSPRPPAGAGAAQPLPDAHLSACRPLPRPPGPAGLQNRVPARGIERHAPLRPGAALRLPQPQLHSPGSPRLPAAAQEPSLS